MVGQRRGRDGAAGVGNGVAEGVGDDLTLRQSIGVGVGVVERIGPAAVGQERQRAVDADQRLPDIDGRAVDRGHGLGVASIDVGVVGQHVAGRRRVADHR